MCYFTRFQLSEARLPFSPLPCSRGKAALGRPPLLMYTTRLMLISILNQLRVHHCCSPSLAVRGVSHASCSTQSQCLCLRFYCLVTKWKAHWGCVSELEAINMDWAYTHEKCKYVHLQGDGLVARLKQFTPPGKRKLNHRLNP